MGMKTLRRAVRREDRHTSVITRGRGDRSAASVGAARDEAGAVLVLALVFLITVSAIVGALSSWAMNDLNTTGVFTSARTNQYAMSSATEVAIQSIRYNPLWSTQTSQTANPSQPTFCWGSGPMSHLSIDGADVAVWCSTAWTPTSANTRLVTFSACPVTATAAACASTPSLQAKVIFGDYAAGKSPPTTGECAVYCGTTMTVSSWLWSPN
jgi:hypothetical protein